MLISFLFLLIIFTNTVSAESSIIYVNDSGGNDSWTGETAIWDGSTLLGPKKSIKNATATVTDGGIVNIANGIYTGTGNTNITIDKNMAIIGQSKANTIINGTNNTGIFLIQNGVNVLIQDLTLTNGNNTDGGAINNGGNLTVINCNLTGNSRLYGGAICNYGNCTVDESAFTSNNVIGNGAAIWNSGTLIVNSSNFTGNTATWYGGAIYNNGT